MLLTKQHSIYKLLDSTKRCKWDVGGKSVFFTAINSQEVISDIDRIINDYISSSLDQFSHGKAGLVNTKCCKQDTKS